MTRAVLDANVLASGLAGLTRSASVPGDVLRQWSTGGFTLVTSLPIEREVEIAFGKRWFRDTVSDFERRRFLALLATDAEWVRDLPNIVGVASHWHDDLVVATAVGGSAEAIVTGDRGLLRIGGYGSIVVMTPRRFLRLLAES